jgi:ribosomal protein L28
MLVKNLHVLSVPSADQIADPLTNSHSHHQTMRLFEPNLKCSHVINPLSL